MSILLVILVIFITNISNNLHNLVTENVLVSIHLLQLTHVLISEASIINRYAEKTDRLRLLSMFAINMMCFYITNNALFSEIPQTVS